MQTFGFPLILALSAPLQLTSPQPVHNGHRTTSLATARNRYRPLLVFAPEANDPRLHQQIDLLHTKDLLDRNILVIPVLGKGLPTYTGHLNDTVLATLPPKDDLALRHHFHIGQSDFAVLLLGKDGEEKVRSLSPLSAEDLTRLVDAMPMRQQEMKSQPAH